MSALTDLFSAMANKIRSKTGTATTYTPSEMVSDGIDDVYDAGVASATTPITPSNSSPASMTANTGYKPTVNGVAVETVGSATASNTNPPTVGVDVPIIMSSATGRQSVRIVDSITEVTPSNSSPVTLSANSIAQIKDAGVAILSYTGITPSNSSPVSLSSGSIYKMGGGGYAISSYSSKTPSDTSPASVSSGAIIKASSSGYLYKTGLPILGQQPNAEFSNNTAGTSGSVDITVTQKPRYIIMSISSRTSAYLHQMGVIDVTGAKAWRMGCNADGTYSENWSNYTTYFTTISASKVTFSYAAASYNKRVVIQIYY